MSIFWTKDKIEILKSYLQSGMNFKNIAIKMNSSYDAVGNAVKRYGLGAFKPVRPTTEKIFQNTNLEELNDKNFEELKEQAKLQWD
ncbi:MAG: hypothetical protein AABY22_34215, partial [Nanoarchaeota archaeon]